MNNLTTFADFAKGEPLKTSFDKTSSEPTGSTAAISATPINIDAAGNSDLEEDVTPAKTPAKDLEVLPRDSNKNFTTHYTKYFAKKPAHQDLKSGDVNMKMFKDAYESTEKEFTSLLRELNRIESGRPDLKKDAAEVKKCFSELLVKLQFFTEYVQPPETPEERAERLKLKK